MTSRRGARTRGGGARTRSADQAFETAAQAPPPQTEPPPSKRGRRVQTVNELQVRKAELQKSLEEDDGSSIVVETVKIVFEYQETQDDIDDAKVFAPFKGKIPISKYPTEAKRAYDRIAARKANATKAAKKAKIADLEVLKAKLTAEVQELSARVAALPGSAVWHS